MPQITQPPFPQVTAANAAAVLGAILGVFITSLVGILIMLLIPPKAQEHWGFHNWSSRTPN